MATKKNSKARASGRKRGRPAAALPDREWAVAEVQRLTNFAVALQTMAEDTRRAPYAPSVSRAWAKAATDVRARLQQFQQQLPARYRAGKPAQVYLELGNVGALDGPLREQRDQALRDAIDAVRTFFVCRQAAEGAAIVRLLRESEALREWLRESRAKPQVRQSETAAAAAEHLPSLTGKADAACGRARALWIGRAGETIRGRFKEALAAVDTIEKWPRELTADAGHTSRAIITVSLATGASIDTVKRALS